MNQDDIPAAERGGLMPASVNSSRKEATIEVCVFLFLIVPSMALSFFLVGTEQGRVSFTFLAVSTILRDLALVSLIFFFLWRNREPVTAVGWRSQGLDTNILLGFVLYIPFAAVISAVERLLRAAGLSAPSAPGSSLFRFHGTGDLALAVLLVVVVAISEETIFRGYLTLRLRTATRSTWVAVVLASAIFALGHGYEGSLGVVTVGIMGVLLNLIYLWRKSLVAPIVMHFLQDFIAIVLVRYLVK
jgi:membrane protease YdiL (CAAX protease family)